MHGFWSVVEIPLLVLGMGNIEILCCDMHLLKYYDYCKYHNIIQKYIKIISIRYNFIPYVKNFDIFSIHICMIYHRNGISILKVSSILVITALSWLHDHIITFPTRFSAFHNQQLKYEY